MLQSTKFMRWLILFASRGKRSAKIRKQLIDQVECWYDAPDSPEQMLINRVVLALRNYWQIDHPNRKQIVAEFKKLQDALDVADYR